MMRLEAGSVAPAAQARPGDGWNPGAVGHAPRARSRGARSGGAPSATSGVRFVAGGIWSWSSAPGWPARRRGLRCRSAAIAREVMPPPAPRPRPRRRPGASMLRRAIGIAAPASRGLPNDTLLEGDFGSREPNATRRRRCRRAAAITPRRLACRSRASTRPARQPLVRRSRWCRTASTSPPRSGAGSARARVVSQDSIAGSARRVRTGDR